MTTTDKKSKSYRSHGNGRDMRGNSRDRAARRTYLLSPVAGFGGNGHTVACVHGCGTMVSHADMHVDRIIPETQGGTYRRGNIQPSCARCNIARSDNVEWTLTITVKLTRSGS